MDTHITDAIHHGNYYGKVNTLLWAVVGREDEGHGAKIFASLGTTPPVEWLFEIERREESTLADWEAASKRAKSAGEVPDSRPIAHLRLLFPVAADANALHLTPTATNLIPWLLHHLERIEFVDWVISKLDVGRRPHRHLRSELRKSLSREPRLPPGFELFWRIVSAEGLWVRNDISEYAWWEVSCGIQGHEHEQWLCQEFLALLRPHLHLSKASFRIWRVATEDQGSSTESIGERFGSIADASVRLAAHSRFPQVIEAIDRIADPAGFLATLSTHITELLRTALDLFAVAGLANIDWDFSAIDRPSIQPHAQNHTFREWTLLFDILWRGWRRVDETSAEESRRLVQRWRDTPYLAFRRLTIAAVTESHNFSATEKMEILLDAT